MDVEKNDPQQPESIRGRAEEIARQREAQTPGGPAAPSSEEARQALHELRVHQIELEMQNEELRRVQAELETSRVRYFDLYDLAPMGYFTLSETGMILESNLRAAAMLGVDRMTVVKHPLSHFLLPEDQDIYYRHHRGLIETGMRHVCELRMLRTGAPPFWARLEESAIQGGYSTPAFLVVVIDISEGKRAEMERQIIEGHLLQAQKMESVGRLAGGVAHEFNNMLQVINAHADLAQKSIAPSDPLNSHLQAIAKAGSRSADIVRQLLAFARKQIITPQILDLNAVIANTLEILRGLIGENIDTLWKPAPHSCSVKMDRTQIDQILVNLVLNARDAIAGIGRIAIETDTVELGKVDSQSHPGIPPGSYVLLAVGDNGSGIDQETQSKLFEPFFTTKPQGAGTGLGLSTVYGIVKQNNGFIEVSSKRGEGTTFRIFLPREEAGARLPESAFVKRELPGGNETVLLVEDEEALLRIGRLLLEDLGYKVLAASGPNQGIRIAAEYAGDIHLLLTDVVMPEMSGRELRDRLHALRPRRAAWHSFWCSIWRRTIKASSPTWWSATPACRSSRLRTGCPSSPTAHTSSRPTGTWPC